MSNYLQTRSGAAGWFVIGIVLGILLVIGGILKLIF